MDFWVQPLQRDERMRDRHQRHVMVPALPGTPLEVVQPQRVLQLPIIVFHPPAQVGSFSEQVWGVSGL